MELRTIGTRARNLESDPFQQDQTARDKKAARRHILKTGLFEYPNRLQISAPGLSFRPGERYASGTKSKNLDKNEVRV